MSLNDLFAGVFSGSGTASTSAITVSTFLICLAVSLAIGLFIAVSYTYRTKYTKSFVVTLATLPAVVAMVIMMVNGNIGAGVAVAGTFSLVRFRSVPGTAKEIGAIFLSMGAGLAVGMGYLAYAALFAIIVSVIGIIYTLSSVGNRKTTERMLKITIPEELDYSGVFDDLFNKYTSNFELVNVKTANMGSMFKLTYDVTLNDAALEKAFIDDLRSRNGNLEIVLAKQSSLACEL